VGCRVYISIYISQNFDVCVVLIIVIIIIIKSTVTAVMLLIVTSEPLGSNPERNIDCPVYGFFLSPSLRVYECFLTRGHDRFLSHFSIFLTHNLHTASISGLHNVKESHHVVQSYHYYSQHRVIFSNTSFVPFGKHEIVQ
jgi:hypothetical protein